MRHAPQPCVPNARVRALPRALPPPVENRAGVGARLGALALMAHGATAFAKPVQLDAGLVEGAAAKDPSVRVFRGIPYAAPTPRRRWASCVGGRRSR